MVNVTTQDGVAEWDVDGFSTNSFGGLDLYLNGAVWVQYAPGQWICAELREEDE